MTFIRNLLQAAADSTAPSCSLLGHSPYWQSHCCCQRSQSCRWRCHSCCWQNHCSRSMGPLMLQTGATDAADEAKGSPDGVIGSAVTVNVEKVRTSREHVGSVQWREKCECWRQEKKRGGKRRTRNIRRKIDNKEKRKLCRVLTKEGESWRPFIVWRDEGKSWALCTVWREEGEVWRLGTMSK